VQTEAVKYRFSSLLQQSLKLVFYKSYEKNRVAVLGRARDFLFSKQCKVALWPPSYLVDIEGFSSGQGEPELKSDH
jgi:hypothetical protein